MTGIPLVLGWDVERAAEYLREQGIKTVTLKRTGKIVDGGWEKVVAQREKEDAVELVYAAFQPPQF